MISGQSLAFNQLEFLNGLQKTKAQNLNEECKHLKNILRATIKRLEKVKENDKKKSIQLENRIFKLEESIKEADRKDINNKKKINELERFLASKELEIKKLKKSLDLSKTERKGREDMLRLKHAQDIYIANKLNKLL